MTKRNRKQKLTKLQRYKLYVHRNKKKLIDYLCFIIAGFIFFLFFVTVVVPILSGP